MALLKILEGWLDEASQKLLRTQLEMQPDLQFQEFMSQLCREFHFVPTKQDRNKWRETTIELEGGRLTFAAWRKFKASLQESLVGVEPPQAEEIREHLLKHLPKGIRDQLIKKEIDGTKKKSWVTVHFPSSANRASVLELVGNHLGLRLQDPDPEVGKIVVNCLTGELVEKALLLDGMQLANLSGRAVGTLTVHQVRSVPMGQKDILDAVDKLMWAESEAQRVAPKTQEKIQERP